MRLVTVVAAILLLLGVCDRVAAGPTASDAAATTSLEEIRKRGEQGDIIAQFMLGFMYEDGRVRGVPQNYIEAAKWYRKAAEQGNQSSMHELGLMYFDGQGVPQDYVLAFMWLNLAAAHAASSDDYYAAKTARDAVAAKMTPAQIAQAQRLASEWRPK